MNALWLALERASLLGLAVLLVALLAQVILDGRVPASWRVWLWRVALLQTALAVMPVAPLRLAVLPPRALEKARPRPVMADAPPFLPSPRELAEVSSALPDVDVAPLPAPISVSPTVRPISVGLFLTALYGLGLAIQLVTFACSLGRVRCLLHDCNPVEEADIRVQLREITDKMRVSPLPRLLKSAGGAPFLVGILRPTIILTHTLLTPQNSDLEAVLWHELVHLKRRDLAWNALLWLVQSLLWFHPLVWVARRFLALETESACDEMVLSSIRIAPKCYGALLLNTMNHPATPLIAGITDGFFALKTRLVRLNRAPKRPRRAGQVAFAMALCLSLGASVPLRFVARAQNKAQATANPYPSDRGIPRDNTPETQVGLPATLEEAQGNASITGRVVYENGKPAAGIRVSAFCVWVAQTELWGYKRNQANKYRWPEKIDKLLSGTAVTKADGSYRFTGLLPQRFRINVISGHFGNRAPVGFLAPYRGVGVVAVAKQTRRAPDTVLRRSALIRIRAVDRDTGVPLEGVMFRGFIINESSVRPTNLAVDAHRKMRPFKGFDSAAITDENGYCTLSLDTGIAYFYMNGGAYMGSPAGEKAVAHFSAFPDKFITDQGLYKSETWCEVTSLLPLASSGRSWKGETAFQLRKGPAANFVVKLKRFKPLTPQYKSLLQTIKKINR